MTFLSQLERVPLQVLVFAALLLFAVGAVRALAILWRVRSDNRAAAVTRAQRPQRPLPTNLAWRPLDFDEHGRSYW